MIYRTLLISSTLLLGGCLSNNVLMSSSTAQINVDRMRCLHVGMTSDEVYEIMHYPATEDRISVDDDCYDIWFYITRSSILDQNCLLTRNLTPLIFRNGIFVGMGKEYYKKLLLTIREPAPFSPPPERPTPASERPTKEERENLPLEKSLNPKGPSSPTNSLSMNTGIVSENDEMEEDSYEYESDSSKTEFDEEDRELLEGEREQNFNFW